MGITRVSLAPIGAGVGITSASLSPIGGGVGITRVSLSPIGGGVGITRVSLSPIGAGVGITSASLSPIGGGVGSIRVPLSPIGGEGRVRGQVRERPRQYARRLRRTQTEAERKLWLRLRDRGLGGVKFRRQHPIGPFITDFCCTEAKLVVELDGGQHALQKRSDAERTALLEGQGYRVFRFWDNDVVTNTEGVLLRIVEALGAKGTSPSPYPLPKGERDSERPIPEGERGSERPIRMKPSPQRGEGRVRGPEVRGPEVRGPEVSGL
jgi:very-short-patch-repair endonuclease